MLERHRLAVGEPDAQEIVDGIAPLDPERGRGGSVSRADRRRDDTGSRRIALAAQILGQTGDGRKVTLDLRLVGEDSAASPRDASDRARPLERVEREAERRPRDPEPICQRALGPQSLTGLNVAAAQILEYLLPDRLGALLRVCALGAQDAPRPVDERTSLARRAVAVSVGTPGSSEG